MTPEHCANLILSLVDVDKRLLKPGVFDAVVAEIAAAMAEAAKDTHWEVWGRVQRALGKTEAYEDAAKVAQSHSLSSNPKKIADEIRALKAKVKA